MSDGFHEEPYGDNNGPDPTPQPNGVDCLPLYWHGEVDPRECRPFLIQDLLPEVGIGLLAGQWGTGKTLTAIELADCVINSRRFLGYDIVRPGGVLFIALEGASEIPIRFQAVLEQKGGDKQYPQKAPFVWTDACPPLIDPKAATIIIATAKAAAARLKKQFNLPLSLIFIDTIVDAAGYRREGADNDTATTQMLMNTMAKVSREVGCFVFGLDHYGKDASVGTRGSSAKEARADVIFACLGDRNEAGQVSKSRLALRKRRSGANGEEFPFKLRRVDMGNDENGRPIGTLVIDWPKPGDDAPIIAKDDNWGKSKGGKGLKLLRRILMQLLADCGEWIKPFADGPTVRVLKLNLIETEFMKTYATTGETEKNKQRAKRTALQRALDDAGDKIVTREIGGQEYVWLSQSGPGEKPPSGQSCAHSNSGATKPPPSGKE
jgi:hypothetical protein